MTLSRRQPQDERQPLLNGTTAASVATGSLTASTNEANIVVEWDSAEDPENPRNFSTGRKTTIIAVLTLITVLSYPSLPPALLG
jgi:hypothetical protein